MSGIALMDSKQRIQEVEYDRSYHWTLNRNGKALYDLRTKKVIELLKDLKGKRCLDTGCGDGKFTSALSSRAKEVLGIDCSKRAIRFSKKLVPEATFLMADASQLCFKDEAFDVVTCMDVMEHLPKDKGERAIKEMYRVIKRKGILIFSVPSKNIPLEKKHYTHFNEADLSKMLEISVNEIVFIGCGIYYPAINRFKDIPIIWRIFHKLIVRTCVPNRSITIIAKVNANDLCAK